MLYSGLVFEVTISLCIIKAVRLRKKVVMAKRIGMSLFGVIICAISVGIFKIAALGVDPFQSFMAGLDSLVPIGFGTLYVITNAVMLLFALIFDRHYIGVVIICFGSAFYMTADLVCVILGVTLFLLAGGAASQIITIAGVGTIITAFFMGPLIEFFNVHIARPFLKGKAKET